MEPQRHVSSSSSTRKRKHFEEVQVDPRYRGLVEYSSGAVDAGPGMNHTNHIGVSNNSNSRMKRHHIEQPTRRPDSREKRVRIVEEPENIDGDGNLSDTGADVGESVVDEVSDRFSEKFNKFNSALAELLALVDERSEVSYPQLDKAIGRERASYVKAMKAMQVEGSLPWLTSIRPITTRQSSYSQRQTSVEPAPLYYPKRSVREGSADRHTRGSSAQRVSSIEPTSRKSSSSSHRTVSGSSVPVLVTNKHYVPDVSILHNTKTSWPPSLPPIRNPKLERQVFTHKSYIENDTSKYDDTNHHNERLEWIGDSCLGAVVTRYIYAAFQDLREGHLSQIRQKFIENSNLTEYAKLYNFDKRLIIGNQQVDKVVGSKKTLADTFEAYIGGLLLDSPQGAEIVDKWLLELFAPKLLEFVDEFRSHTPVNKLAKNHLQSLIGGKYCEFEYKWVGGGGGNAGGYDIECYFSGWGFNKVLLGKASGTNKGEATLRAAMDALANGPLTSIKQAKDQWYRDHPAPQLDVASDNGTIRRMVVS